LQARSLPLITRNACAQSRNGYVRPDTASATRVVDSRITSSRCATVDIGHCCFNAIAHAVACGAACEVPANVDDAPPRPGAVTQVPGPTMSVVDERLLVQFNWRGAVEASVHPVQFTLP